MDSVVLVVFGFVYLGMISGSLPALAIDRTGIALLGAIVLLATGRVSLSEAWNAIDVSTIAILLGLMVVSAQFRLGGFYSAVALRLAVNDASPQRTLVFLIVTSAVLSALLANDIVCLAFTPVLTESCLRRGFRPLPFLLALACASNVGSVATLIGNPQNMLIGQTLGLSFSTYLLDGLVPSVLGCVAIWAVIVRRYRGNWRQPPMEISLPAPAFHCWQTVKGAIVLVTLVIVFLEGSFPREIAALGACGLLLMSRRLHTREMLALVDWQLLVLFAGLFIVNHALATSGALASGISGLTSLGADVRRPAWLFSVAAVLSNLVSNVPAVMLLLPAAEHPQAGAILALSSTLAGNLLIVGSIANIIVVDQAARFGVRVSSRQHAGVGIPVTLSTLLVAAAWLVIRSRLL